MKRVFNMDVLKCPTCGQGKGKLIAMITEAPVIRSILQCLGCGVCVKACPSQAAGLAEHYQKLGVSSFKELRYNPAGEE